MATNLPDTQMRRKTASPRRRAEGKLGGERIALARAFLKDAPIPILDEPVGR